MAPITDGQNGICPIITAFNKSNRNMSIITIRLEFFPLNNDEKFFFGEKISKIRQLFMRINCLRKSSKPAIIAIAIKEVKNNLSKEKCD